MIFKFGQKKAG